ncbi:MAG: tetratricopeptide repeat protein [Actinomycetota bacterium]|nr:tetratricopeptide repeat protein [Actinomycetota bacterium]
MSSSPRRRRVIAIAVVAAGVALFSVSISTLFASPDQPRPAASATPAEQSALNRTIDTAQTKLRRTPNDPATWALLGAAYVEQARVTGDPGYYTKAQGALQKSLDQQPDGNAQALIGQGALANARHDFAVARDWGERAKTVAPDTAEVYGVLADAYTQLGQADAATDAVQRMVDIEPGVPSFTRAAYDFEQRGRIDDARAALERALDTAATTADASFCHYQLGELAFDTGRLDDAAGHYEDGLRADPANAALRQGSAKVAEARGDVPGALGKYRELVNTTPTSQYVHEYALLLLANGRAQEAESQFALIDTQRRLAAASGAGDDLADSVVAADRGDVATALSLAEGEWARRQSAPVADALAWALHLAGRDTEALSYTDKAAASGWVNATFTYHRGMILAALDRAPEAIPVLENALTTNPHFSPVHAPAAERALTELRARR